METTPDQLFHEARRPPESGHGGAHDQQQWLAALAAEVTAAAVAVADRGGLEAVSMRNVAAELGTGAASLYRYVNGREDLLDLMSDATATEYRLGSPTGDRLGGLVVLAEQTHAIMMRHPWLPELVVTRPALGPEAVRVLDHVLDILADHLGDGRAKLEIFALLDAGVATFALNELATADRPEHTGTYLSHVAATGRYPRIAALLGSLAPSDNDPHERRVTALTAILSGLLRLDGSTPRPR